MDRDQDAFRNRESRALARWPPYASARRGPVALQRRLARRCARAASERGCDPRRRGHGARGQSASHRARGERRAATVARRAGRNQAALAEVAESTSDTSSEGGEDSTQISFIHWRGEDKAVLDDIIAQFEDENPNISVEMTIYPSEQYQATGQRLLQDCSTGDVFTSFPVAQFEAIASVGLFEDLSGEYFVSNFDEELISV